MALRYTVDAALIYWTTGLVWTPADYLLSLANISNSKGALFTLGLSMTLIVWTIPFVWIGVILSVRRAKDAGLPPWIVVAFFMPVLNYLLMAMLAAWPRAEAVPARADERQVTVLIGPRWRGKVCSPASQPGWWPASSRSSSARCSSSRMAP